MNKPLEDGRIQMTPEEILQKQLDEANATLERAHAINLPLEVLERAMIRKLTIEKIFAEAERNREAELAEARREREAMEKRKQIREQRMQTDPV